MQVSSTKRRTFLLVLLLLSAGISTASAQAFTESNFVTFTLEGCRNNGTITLPIGGQFVCPDAAYTTGNLGKGWNELDLVPHRLTTQLGSQAAATTDYNVYVAADYQTSGKIGYDVISFPAINGGKSDASCSVSAGSQLTQGSAGAPFGGGTDIVTYRQLTVHQNKGTTCVIDYYQRLALGSHLYSGSSLQSYMFPQTGLSGGKKTISIPVNEILPQSLSKDMSAIQGSSYPWTILKSATANTLPFGDVCAANAPTNLPLSFTVTWTRGTPDASGNISVTTHVYATNPAARTITTSVTDVIYSGTTTLDTSTASADVPANTANYLILTHTLAVAAGATNLNDIATGTYTDTVTGIAIPGTTTATASAAVQNTGPQQNASSSILDIESMTGQGLTFSVPAPSFGSFVQDATTLQTYAAGTQTIGPVDWNSGNQTGNNSITFNKTVYLDVARITSGTITDTATLTGVDGFSAAAGPVNVNISSSASPKLTISKSIPSGLLSSGQTIVVSFTVTRATDVNYSVNTTLTFAGGGLTTQSTTITGPDADTYYVNETNALFFPVGCSTTLCALPAALTPQGGSSQTVNLSKDATTGVLTSCTGTATFTNVIPNTFFPTVQVRKSTLPNTDTSAWTFTLKGPGISASGVTANAVANSGQYVGFGVSLGQPGTYTVTETTKSNWYLNSASPNDPSAPKVCTFKVVYPNDFVAGRVFNCDFQNTQQYVKVIKTVQGAAPGGTQSFIFQLRQGATATDNGTILETKAADSTNGGVVTFTTLLIPGQSYQFCETVMPGWLTNLGTFVPGSFNPPDGTVPNPNVDNSILCVNFSVSAGETKTFTVDNSPPPGGRALTIGFWKNWASCASSNGKQKPVLDQTMANATAPGIQLGTSPNYGYLLGDPVHPNVAPDCSKAVNILNKATFAGQKMSSDPLFNMAAQLVAAELNRAAGAGTCGPVITAISQANALLAKYKFTGNGYTGKLSAADATLANNVAKRLDDYNNDRPAACQ